MNVPQIDVGQTSSQYLDVRQMWLLPAQTPYGNMALKHMKIVQTIMYVNTKINHIYSDWQKLNIGSQQKPFDPTSYPDPTLHLLYIEEAIYFLRRLADDLISISFLLYQFRLNGQYPSKMEIDSIGSLLEKKKHLEFKEKLSNAEPFLTSLNDISNAYKHSFINSDQSTLGKEEPCVPALALKRNDLQQNPVFHLVTLSQVVSEFNKFYNLMKEFILEHNPGHQSAG